MLMETIHLLPINQKQPPWYIVMEHVIKPEGPSRYVSRYGVSRVPVFPCDDITETTENIWEAAMFCNLEDAVKIKELCNFKCNCGCIEHIGKILQVTLSPQKIDGIHYGFSDCSEPGYAQKHFEGMYVVTEISI